MRPEILRATDETRGTKGFRENKAPVSPRVAIPGILSQAVMWRMLGASRRPAEGLWTSPEPWPSEHCLQGCKYLVLTGQATNHAQITRAPDWRHSCPPLDTIRQTFRFPAPS